MDFEIILRWLGAAGLLLSIINTSWVLIKTGGQETADELDRHETKLTDHDRRIQALEGEQKHLVTKEDLTELRLQLSDLNGKLGRFDEAMESIARTVRRIDDYLRIEKT